MKLNLTLFTALFAVTTLFAQSPEKMNYQAVVRNASNALVVSQAIGVKVSILQGSATGSSVYVETQNPNTNVNGLMTLEIGLGTIISGNFSTISWENGPFFLKTEVDPTGGSSYSITGTSQFLSVPYALHSKTADNISGGITEIDPVFNSSVAAGITTANTTNWNNKLSSYTETDPIFNASVASGITTANTTNWNNKLSSYTELDPIFAASIANAITGTDTANWNNKLDSYSETDPLYAASIASGITSTDTANWNNKLAVEIDGSVTNEIQTISRTGTTVTLTNGGSFQDSINTYFSGAGIDITNNVISVSSTCNLSIGDTAHGGIIFYLDASGCHGLVCALSDQSTGVKWRNSTSIDTYAYGSGIGDGLGNTSAINRWQGVGTYAVQVCYNTPISGTVDWYLPSVYELRLMYNNVGQGNSLGLGNAAGFGAGTYWSSTEHSNVVAWFVNFVTGFSDGDTKTVLYRVRAVRLF